MNSNTPSLDHRTTEPHGQSLASRLNWLRAGVLGANDGIVSVAALIVGVAGATTDRAAVLIAAVASLVAGAVSMALGEYVSVSSQRDTERAAIARERHELATEPEAELEELTRLYQDKGLTRETAAHVAQELTSHDALAAHLETELHLDADEQTNPWHAAFASAVSFVVGALLPLVAVLVVPQAWRIPATIVVVLVALAGTGLLSARLGGSAPGRPVLRVVLGGALALVATWGIGRLLGTAVG